MNKLLITGGAGFIGRNLVERLLRDGNWIFIIDHAKEAWSFRNLQELRTMPKIQVCQADIRHRETVSKILNEFGPDGVIHLAAESHVDKSIADPELFLESNVRGTWSLLESVYKYWNEINRPDSFRFHYCSTDEVYGSLDDGSFLETMPLHPNNPYSATKAAGEHLTTAWLKTHGLPVLITRCSNNYGPYQGPDKFVPLTIGRCLRREPVLIHGTGQNIRDWIHVTDHVRGLVEVFHHGAIGETYNIGGGPDSERTNQELAQTICDLYDELTHRSPGTSRQLLTFVTDRPGNDLRYSMNTDKLQRISTWKPEIALETGLRETIQWYVNQIKK